MKITWYGHSCFKIETGDYSFVIDPFTGVPGFSDPEIEANAVYSSHGHYDHNNFDAVSIVEYPGNPPVDVIEVPSFHDTSNGTLRGENLIHVFKCEDMSLAHLGDLGHVLNDEQIKAIGNIDVLMIPVGGFYTIDADAAYEICNQLNPRIIIPMHYKYNGRGIENIASPKDFLSLFPDKTIKCYEEPVVEITSETEPHIAFLG